MKLEDIQKWPWEEFPEDSSTWEHAKKSHEIALRYIEALEKDIKKYEESLTK